MKDFFDPTEITYNIYNISLDIQTPPEHTEQTLSQEVWLDVV